jgi:uroporphyrinogen decarboxylase
MGVLREPDKQRILDAINHIERPDIPLFEIDPDMEIMNRILGKRLPYHLHPFEQEVEDNVELNIRMGNDMLFFSHVWRLGRVDVQDKMGRLHYKDGNIKARTDFDQLWFPDLGTLEHRLEATCKALEGTGMGLMCGAQTAAFTAMTAMGYNDFLLNTLADPDLVMDLIKILHDYCLQEMEIYLQYPVDMMKVGSGIITTTGPMVSWEQVEELETSFIREQIGIIREAGLPVFFHIDGKVDNLIPDFIEMGVDVLNPIDPSGEVQDIFEIKSLYGNHITLSGNINIDTILKNGSPEAVKQDVIEHMERLGKGGGYIVSSSHNLHELIPVENFYAMRDAVMEYNHLY